MKLFCQLRRQRLNVNAQIPARDLAFRHQPAHDIARQVRRHCEANTHVPSGAAQDRRINSRQSAFRIHQRSTRIARINRRIRLDKILVTGYSQSVPTHSAHNSHRHCLADRKWIPNREHRVSNLKLVTVSYWDNWQIMFYLDLQHRDIRRWIRSNSLRLEFPFTIPIVTVWPTANGFPIASTASPTSSLSLSPIGITGRLCFTSIFNTATSVGGSVPIPFASNSRSQFPSSLSGRPQMDSQSRAPRLQPQAC